MKEPNDSVGNRNRDLPAFSAVSQPTAPLLPPPPSYAHSIPKQRYDRHSFRTCHYEAHVNFVGNNINAVRKATTFVKI
jgi:hypothetical protein